MNQDAERLRKMTDAVVDSDRPVTAFGLDMLEFSILLRDLASSNSGYADTKCVHTSRKTETGVAIGAWHASLSLDDRSRTAAFIRGCARAVESALTARPGRPVHFVEAGCGPLATLSTPLMARFGPEQLQVTLIDLHQDSIDSARHVVGELGFTDRLRNTICGDLMTVEIAEAPDVIALETMYAALMKEPQVGLTRRLIRAHPDAIFIPQTISIDAQLINIELESKTIPPTPRDRRLLGRILDLDRASALNVEAENGFLPWATVSIPEIVEPGQRLFLTTSVTVFGGVTFANYDSEITVPVPLSEAEASWRGRELRFRYRINESPRFEWELLPVNPS